VSGEPPVLLLDGSLRCPLTGVAAEIARQLATHQHEINRHPTGSLEFHWSGRQVKPILKAQLVEA